MKHARLGQDGNANALKDLGLVDVKPVRHNDITNPDFDALRGHFVMVGEVRIAARILGHTALKETCEMMLGLVHYAAACKFDADLAFRPNLDNIWDTMDTLVSSIKAFLNYIGETNGVGVLQQMKQLIQKARYGNREAVAFLSMEEIPQLHFTNVKKPPRFLKLLTFYQCYQTYAQVGQLVKNQTLNYVDKKACTYLVWIASETEPHQTMASTVDGQDICTTLLVELEFIRDFIRLSQRKVIQYEGKRLKGEVPEIEEELHDPSYQPKEEGDAQFHAMV